MPTSRSCADAEPTVSAVVTPPITARTAASTVSLIQLRRLREACAVTRSRPGRDLFPRRGGHVGRAASAGYIGVAALAEYMCDGDILDDQSSAPDPACVVHDLSGQQAAVQRPELVVVDERGDDVGRLQ